MIRDVDRDVIEEEITTRIARYIHDSYAEIGVVEIAGAPRAAPCIGCAPKDVSSFRCAEGHGGLGRRPGYAAIPRELHADIRRAASCLDSCIEAHLNTPDHSGCRQAKIVVGVVVLIFAVIGTGYVFVRAAVGIACDR